MRTRPLFRTKCYIMAIGAIYQYTSCCRQRHPGEIIDNCQRPDLPAVEQLVQQAIHLSSGQLAEELHDFRSTWPGFPLPPHPTYRRSDAPAAAGRTSAFPRCCLQPRWGICPAEPGSLVASDLGQIAPVIEPPPLYQTVAVDAAWYAVQCVLRKCTIAPLAHCFCQHLTHRCLQAGHRRQQTPRLPGRAALGKV